MASLSVSQRVNGFEYKNVGNWSRKKVMQVPIWICLKALKNVVIGPSIIDCLGLRITIEEVGWWTISQQLKSISFQKLDSDQQEGSCEINQSVNHIYWQANVQKLQKVRQQFPRAPVVNSKNIRGEVSFEKWHRILRVMANNLSLILSWVFLK